MDTTTNHPAGDGGGEASARVSQSPLDSVVAEHLKWLKSHYESGRIDSATLNQIIEYENGGNSFVPSTQYPRLSLKNLAIGIAALLASGLLMGGFGMLGELWGVGGEDYSQSIAFFLMALVGSTLYFIPVVGHAKQLLWESSLILVWAGLSFAWLTLPDSSWKGPLEVLAWGPTLLIWGAAIVVSRRVVQDGVISSVVIGFGVLVPFATAAGSTDTEYARIISLSMIWLVLLSDLLFAWMKSEGRNNLLPQRVVLAIILGAWGWALPEFFGEWSQSLSPSTNDEGWYSGGVAIIVLSMGLLWIGGNHLFTARFPNWKEDNSKLILGWIGMLPVLILAALPLRFGFALAEWLSLPNIEIGDWDMSLAWPIAILCHLLLMIGLLKGKVVDLSWLRDEERNLLAPKVMIQISFSVLWFLSALIAFMEEDSTYVLLPVGLLALGLLAWKLTGSKNEAELNIAISETLLIDEEKNR